MFKKRYVMTYVRYVGKMYVEAGYVLCFCGVTMETLVYFDL